MSLLHRRSQTLAELLAPYRISPTTSGPTVVGSRHGMLSFRSARPVDLVCVTDRADGVDAVLAFDAAAPVAATVGSPTTLATYSESDLLGHPVPNDRPEQLSPAPEARVGSAVA